MGDGQMQSSFFRDILIVDDTVNNLRLLSDMLARAGFSVRKAINGTMALMAVEANQPDVILLDINMPDMNGYEVCEKLKKYELTKEIPVIFLSASDVVADKIQAFKVGGVDYITKPFYAEEVITRIRHQLSLSTLKNELKAKNKNLEVTLSQLKSTQVQLIQNEKMMGLNHLIAGIAHEINNPITFISGNLNHTQHYFLEILNILDLYRQHYPQPNQEIQDAIDAVDLEFIIQDFQSVFQSMNTGTQRISEIVQALKTFAYHGEAKIKSIDLHRTLDSILVLLQSRLCRISNRPNINVSCQYGSLPKITCEAKLISQAILHIINNAIDAIDMRWAQSAPRLNYGNDKLNPEILITTSTPTPTSISISIQDNGIGIADNIQSKVYDPFFTTKSVGQGKGLGLSTSYQIIVNQHGGQLDFSSSHDQGTRFTLTLPIHGKVQANDP